MTFILNDEEQMLRDSAKSFLKQTSPVSALRKLRDDKDIRSFYLGVATEGTARESFRDIKHYKRRKRWLS